LASIKAALINSAKSFTQVASLAGERVYPNRAFQGESQIPCVTIQVDTKDRFQRLDGFDDSLINEEFSIRAYAFDSATATTIGASLAEALEAIENTNITDAIAGNGRRVGSVILLDEQDDAEPLGELSDRMIHFYELRVQIHHTPIPA